MEKQVQRLRAGMDRPPIIISPYDAELYGHWWYEGPIFLSDLFRQLHFDQSVIEPLTPDVRATPLDPPRPKSDSMAQKLDEVDEGWDLGEEDPTAGAPSTTEMAGDGSVEGDGLDQVD